MGETAQIITAICSVITAIGVPVIAAYVVLKQAQMKNDFDMAQAQLKLDADARRVQAEEVKTTLATNTTKTDAKLDVIHKLVNAAMTAQLKINAVQARRIADENPNSLDDQAAAEAAEKLYCDQLAGQSGGPTP